MVATAYIEHRIPGRMRLRIPERRGNVAFFERIVGTLSKLPDVEELAGSPLTGSVRIRHSGSGEAITAAAAEKGLFKVGKPEGKAEAAKPKQPHGDAGMLDTIATGLSGLAVLQVTQGQITGSAAENFWNAYGAQRLLGNTAITAGFGLLGIYQLLQGQWLGSASSLLFYALAARQLAALDRAAGATTSRGEPPKRQPAPKRGVQKASKKSGVSD
jgi:hypothetical protein